MPGSWIKDTTSTTGTGTITLGGAASARWAAIADSTSDGEEIQYAIINGDNRESVTGVFTAAGPTLTRATVHETIVGGVYDGSPSGPINLSGDSTVIITNTVTNRSNVKASLSPPNTTSKRIQFGTLRNNSFFTTAVCAANEIRFMEAPVAATLMVASMGVEITALAAAENVRLGIYKKIGPGNLWAQIASTGDIDISATGEKEAVLTGGTLTLEPDNYLFAVGKDAGLSTSTRASNGYQPQFLVFDDIESGVAEGYSRASGYSGGLPASVTLAETDIDNVPPNIWAVTP